MTLTYRHQAQHQATWYTDYEVLPLDLADALRYARLERRLTLRQAARLAHIDHSYLSRLERGLRAPRIGTAVRLAQVLDLDDDLAEELLAASVDEYDGPLRR